ncbi:MAG: DUF4159 domain-containing protein [Bacteroidetes bacterium]|nr:DUF4159 domain-containing protein [Bacteroidota bacterium]
MKPAVKYRWTISVIFLGLGLLLLPSFTHQSQGGYSIKLGRLKYNGGGDWYSSRTALPNLSRFCNSQLGMGIDPNEGLADIASPDIYNYPYLFMTGHGNVVFSEAEATNLRTYLEAGGFLHICDNYGLDKFVRPQMKKVFPELEFVELPHSHPIYHAAYNFPSGLVKVHEHNGKAPQGFGLIWKGRLVCFYDYECDLGNGWEDPEVYNDPEPVRQKALQMGANILHYIFNN